MSFFFSSHLTASSTIVIRIEQLMTVQHHRMLNAISKVHKMLDRCLVPGGRGVALICSESNSYLTLFLLRKHLF